ncbi:MAG: hypothetical protein AAB546_03310 [Patescibacteria group bacterium]
MKKESKMFLKLSKISLFRRVREFVLVLAVLTVITLLYLPISKGYFQHDEIFGVTRNMSLKGTGLYNLIKIAFTPYISHFVPLHQLMVQVYISWFSFNYQYYTYASIVAHLLVVFLVYLLLSKLTKNKNYSLLGALLFGVNASGHQATSWPLADINTHGATIFGLASLIFLVSYINQESKRYYLLAMGCLFVSLLFKEITIGFFLFIPVMYFLYSKKKQNVKYVTGVAFASLFTYLLLRVSMIFAPRSHPLDQVVTQSQSYLEIAINLLTFPIKILVQTLIPPRQLLVISRFLTGILPWEFTGSIGTTQFDLFVENITLFVLEIVIFILICVFLFFAFKKNRNGIQTRVAFLGFAFVVINSFIYALSPYRSASIPVIDSRNLYLPTFGSIVMLISLVQMFFNKNSQKYSYLLLFLPLLIVNIFWLNKEVVNISDQGRIRKQILNKIKTGHPMIEDKTIFYTESDKAFYGLSEEDTIFPFQINFGFNLMTIYQTKKDYPYKLVDGKVFLRDITDQGYLEIDGKGFGYYRDLELLKKGLLENKLSKQNVIAYRYYSKTGEVIDITEEIRNKL